MGVRCHSSLLQWNVYLRETIFLQNSPLHIPNICWTFSIYIARGWKINSRFLQKPKILQGISKYLIDFFIDILGSNLNKIGYLNEKLRFQLFCYNSKKLFMVTLNFFTFNIVYYNTQWHFQIFRCISSYIA